MSIGEVVNLYKENELVINPSFQRLFRWESGQKSKLVESLLLGIPLPPIFVFEREDAKWELIDGLQRLSTILEFMGLLRGVDGVLKPPSYLESTKYLPSLRNVVWTTSDQITEVEVNDQEPLDRSQQLAIRRARLGVEILKRPSDNNTKFDLFQRLNSAGTPANAQEIRNCIVIMINDDFFEVLKSLANNSDFLAVIDVNDDQLEKQKNFEYACRFLTHVLIPYDSKLDVEEYIDESIKQIAVRRDIAKIRKTFESTFKLLNNVYGNTALKRRSSTGKISGKIGLAAFESIAVGIGRNIAAILKLDDSEAYVRSRVTKFWASSKISSFFALGLRGTYRISRTVPHGDKWFKP